MSLINLKWNWILLRGVLGVLFGVLAIARPGLTLAAIVMVFGVYAIVDGIYLAVTSINSRRGEPNWGWYLLGGLAEFAVGVMVLATPGITAIMLLYLVAGWAIVRGAVEIVAAIQWRKVIKGEWVYILAGILSIAFGIFLFARPVMGTLALMVWFGLYAIFFGIVLIVLAFRVKRIGPQLAAV